MTDDASLFAAVDATWPAAECIPHGPWMLRRGQGGGKRVSAATAIGPITPDAIDDAEQAMRGLQQTPLFMIRKGEDALDAALQARGYSVVDPVTVLTCPIENLTNQPIPPVTTFTIWEPLAIMAEIWAQGGVGPARLDVMRRAAVKTALLARWNQKPAGTGFVAVDGPVAMVHAVEVLPNQRGQGVAQWIMRQAAFWATQQGATTMSVLCTKANAPGQALYQRLGFTPAAAYHYRQKTSDGDPRHG